MALPLFGGGAGRLASTGSSGGRGVEIEFCAVGVDRPAAAIQPLTVRSLLGPGAIPAAIDRRADLRTDFMLQTGIQGFCDLPMKSGRRHPCPAADAAAARRGGRDVVDTTSRA